MTNGTLRARDAGHRHPPSGDNLHQVVEVSTITSPVASEMETDGSSEYVSGVEIFIPNANADDVRKSLTQEKLKQLVSGKDGGRVSRRKPDELGTFYVSATF